MSTLKKFDKTKLNAAGAAPVEAEPKKDKKELPTKKAIVKKDKLKEEEALQQVSDIINPPLPEDEQPLTKKARETNIRVTIDLPESLHTKLKTHLVVTGFTMKE